MKRKKKQHYVFRGHLRAWSENGKIFCLRKGRVFQSDLAEVACERFFYRFRDLTLSEIQLIEKAFIENVTEPLRTYQKRLLFILTFPPKLRAQLDAGVNSEYIAALDKMIANGEEDYHQRIEDELLVFIRHMLAGNTDFYSDAEQAAKFLYALCVQYTRTKKIRQAAVAQIGTDFHGCDMRRVMSVLSPLIAMSAGQSLYADRNQFRLVLIDNDTDTPFITADQPIVNLQATHHRRPPEKFELFYPLSPKKAMLLVESSSRRGDFPLSAVSVNHYNMLMIENSYEQVFSNSEDYLSSVKNVVKMGST